MVSLGLLNLVSDAYLVKPDKSTSSSGGNGVAQLNSTLNKLSSGFQSQASTATVSSSSSRLADDTYTPSSQGSQGDTVTLANLVKNQTISGSSEVRQVLGAAVAQMESVDPEAIAWNDLADKVSSGDYSGAQAALADYGTALVNSHIGMWADVTPIQNDLAALGNALQTGEADDVQTAFTALTKIAPTHNLGLGLTSEPSTWEAANMADALQKLGYTATNATVEANAFVLGYAADAATIHVVTQGALSDQISDQSNADQWITALAKDVTHVNPGGQSATTDNNLMSSILASMAHANTQFAMNQTLSQLVSKYEDGSQSQFGSTTNAGQAGVSVYA